MRTAAAEPPCAADLVVHLDLVRRAVDVHAAAMLSRSGEHAGGPSPDRFSAQERPDLA